MCKVPKFHRGVGDKKALPFCHMGMAIRKRYLHPENRSIVPNVNG